MKTPFWENIKFFGCEWNLPKQDGALDGGDAEHAVRVALGLGGGDAAAAATAATQGLSRWRRLRGRGGV